MGYGLGDFAMNLAFSMGTAFLLYYLTDVAGLTAAAVGTMFIVRLWDAFTDLFAGRMVDRTMTCWGKFRPFLLWFAVPVLVLSFLNFNVPTKGIKWLGLFTWDLDANGRLLYAYLAYAILGLCYSLINIPYGSMASAMTQSVNERAKLVAARAFGAAIGGVSLTYVVAPQISALQKTAPKLAPNADAAAKAAYETAVAAYRQNANIFTTTTLLFIVIGTIAYLPTFFWCREAVVRTTPRHDQGHDRHPQADQAPGVPLRGVLLLPDRPRRGGRLDGLLRQVRDGRHRPDGQHDAGQLGASPC